MKLSEDQKKMAKTAIIYLAIFLIIYPLFRWILGKGEFWDNFLISCGSAILIALFFVVLIIGAKVPKKKD
ncbi:MAG TPA: hypothetical protein PLU97_01565 [Candidatus Cryptobacteroides sp.]|jgi:hypothetical protein|nr:hypothetical protein [Candidatus Cryptobacteroides sp.]